MNRLLRGESLPPVDAPAAADPAPGNPGPA